jgi:hypothetical protein
MINCGESIWLARLGGAFGKSSSTLALTFIKEFIEGEFKKE